MKKRLVEKNVPTDHLKDAFQARVLVPVLWVTDRI